MKILCLLAAISLLAGCSSNKNESPNQTIEDTGYGGGGSPGF